MNMPINEMRLQIEGESAVRALQEALQALDTAEGEMVLDFSSVPRVDPAALQVMEKLAATAGAKSVKVVLRGVNIDIYRALKLMKLTPRFSFLA